MASSSSSSHSAPVSSSRSYKYDVFLSFRGEDTRKTFVDHLYLALVQRLIHTYKDDETLQQGESISPTLIAAIEESHIAVIVFSTNYANSSWCLEELTHIMKFKKERGLIVIPLFYDVEPSEVRKQTGDFGKGFTKQVAKNSAKVESWKKALVDASGISGWEIKNVANGHESKAIKEIVNTIFDRLFSSNSHVDEDLVGMTGRLQELESRLKIGTDGVRMVGIWGVGGGGKTTLATSVYTKNSYHFEGHCIVENIRATSNEAGGLQKLQENMLSAVFNTEVKVFGNEEGRNKIKSMLCNRKVLIVLDDVDKREQLEALARSRNWFGNGSRIIITTRDEHLLETHKVDDICLLRLLSNQEAIKLFNKHAYNEKKLIKDYIKLSLDVVSYADGLPLAIKVLGSFLFDKNEEEWTSALARLNASPEMEIVEKLKISYDGLKKEEKELFLEIACFFRGWYSTKYIYKELLLDIISFSRGEYTKVIYNNARDILEACGFHLEIGIKVLRQKSLITIDADGRFEMHDLIQEMGHYIVRGEHPNNPENHSRLWKRDEIMNLCLGHTSKENDKIEAIRYGYPGRSSQFYKFVSNVKRLRWLDVSTVYNDGAPMYPKHWLDANMVDNDQNDKGLNFRRVIMNDKFGKGPTFLSNEMRYIYWTGYPGISFPGSFQPMKLVVLILYHSLQKVLWKGDKSLPCLKVLRLEEMENLISIPDFDRLPCLQTLIRDSCRMLKEIHPSLGNHTSLEYVRVSYCRKLRKFPTIVHMEKLNTLHLSGCDSICEFPEIQSNLGSFLNLSLERVGINVLPSLIAERFTNLTSLVLRNLDNLKSIEFNFAAFKSLEEVKYTGNQKMPPQHFKTTFHQFPRSLRKLDLSSCHLKDGKILCGIVELSNLEELDLSHNDFTRLDFSLLQLTRLKLLDLRNCYCLVELPELPSNLAILTADRCESLTAIRDSFTNCKWLCGVSLGYVKIVNDGGRLLESMLQGNGVESGNMVLRVEGVQIAKEFIPGLYGGRRCRLQLPNKWCDDFTGFLICGVFRDPSISFSISLRMKQENDDDIMAWNSKENDDDINVSWKESDGGGSYHTWVGYVSFDLLRHTSWWEWAQTYTALSFSIENSTRESCGGLGVRLVKSGSGSGLTASSQFSHESRLYAPSFKIRHDSTHALEISMGMS